MPLFPLFLIAVILTHVNLIVHGFGSFLLIRVIKKGETHPQLLCIFNLSLSLFLKSGLTTVLCYVRLFPKTIIRYAKPYIFINLQIVLELLVFLFMVYLTLDRLLAVALNIKYRIYCTVYKAKVVLKSTWLVVVILGLSLCLLYAFHVISYKIYPYRSYIHITLNFGFIIFSFVTYGYIFYKYANSLLRQSSRETSTNDNGGLFQVFLQSNFSIALLMIANFLLFIIVPQIIDIILGFSFIKEDIIWSRARILMNKTADLTNALIYVFMERRVRRLFFKYLLCCHCSVEEGGVQNAEIQQVPVPQGIAVSQVCIFQPEVTLPKDLSLPPESSLVEERILHGKFPSPQEGSLQKQIALPQECSVQIPFSLSQQLPLPQKGSAHQEVALSQELKLTKEFISSHELSSPQECPLQQEEILV